MYALPRSDGEKGMYAFVRVLVLGACVCVPDANFNALPQSDRDRKYEDKAGLRIADL